LYRALLSRCEWVRRDGKALGDLGEWENVIRRMKGKLLDAVGDVLPDRMAIQLGYFRAFKTLPDLKNPKTLNEKIQWRKLNQHDPRFITFSDKIAAKAEVAKLVGAEHVIENLWVGTRPEEIPWDELEPPYVIKTNHTSGCNLFVRRGDLVDRAGLTRELNKQLQFDHSHRWREWSYKRINRWILIERMLESSSGVVPPDVRFFVYHGAVRCISVALGRYEMKVPTTDYFDRKWSPLEVCEYGYPRWRHGVARPENLDEAVAIVEKIAAPFDFVRIDMYLEGGRVYFGEASFYPAAGFSRFEPPEWDLRFGELWKVEHGSKVPEPDYANMRHRAIEKETT